MRRLCERPGCSAPAAVSYGMDHDALLVWVDANPSVDPARAGSLCRRHADALTPPRGWTLDDRRDPVPRLLRVAENPVPADLTPSAGMRKRKKRVEAVDIPTLFAEIAAATDADTDADTATVESETPAESEVPAATDDGADPDETLALPWSPSLGKGEIVVPAGRLLRRAFGRRA